MTARPVIAARSCSVNALPSRLANRSSSFVSCGSHDRRRTNVLCRLVGVTSTVTSTTPDSTRSKLSSSSERSSSVANSGLPAVAKSRCRNRPPGAAPVSMLARACTSMSSSPTRRTWRPAPLCTVSTRRSSAGGHGDGRNDAMTANEETGTRRARAIRTASERSSAQCRSSAATSSRSCRDISSTRSTLASTTA